MLIGFGNIIRLAGDGDFVSWTQSLSEFGYYAIMGLILLPLVRMFTDKVLLPGARLSDELVQDVPSVGAGAIEATIVPRRVGPDRVDALSVDPSRRQAACAEHGLVPPGPMVRPIPLGCLQHRGHALEHLQVRHQTIDTDMLKFNA